MPRTAAEQATSISGDSNSQLARRYASRPIPRMNRNRPFRPMAVVLYFGRSKTAEVSTLFLLSAVNLGSLPERGVVHAFRLTVRRSRIGSAAFTSVGSSLFRLPADLRSQCNQIL